MKRIAVRGRDLTGLGRGRLTALYPVDDGKVRINRNQRWLCQCSCGNLSVVANCALVSPTSTTVSCGCNKKEKSSVACKSRATHGMSYSKEWSAWSKMKDRCAFRGGWADRGITICERWLSFENFLADMGPIPADKESLDRKDNEGNYEPGNCRWANRSEQNRNKRSNVIVTAFGRTALLIEFAPIEGDYKRAWRRIKRYGWDVERAIAAPPYSGR